MRNTRTLRVELPNDVWERLNSEAAAKGKKIGTHMRDLIVTRDASRRPKKAGAKD